MIIIYLYIVYIRRVTRTGFVIAFHLTNSSARLLQVCRHLLLKWSKVNELYEARSGNKYRGWILQRHEQYCLQNTKVTNNLTLGIGPVSGQISFVYRYNFNDPHEAFGQLMWIKAYYSHGRRQCRVRHQTTSWLTTIWQTSWNKSIREKVKFVRLLIKLFNRSLAK